MQAGALVVAGPLGVPTQSLSAATLRSQRSLFFDLKEFRAEIVLAVLKMIFNFFLGPPLRRGVPGEGPDCHFPKEIVGFGPIPARILKFFNFYFGLKLS